MLENMGTPSAVIILVNKRYFIEDKFLIVDCFYDQKKTRPLRDWIGLYPCENIKLHEPLIFEYVMDHPRIAAGCIKVRFIPQLFSKFIHCSRKYQFVYVNSYFKVIATSKVIEFVHKNDCNCNFIFDQPNHMVHIKMGQDINMVIQRLKCLEAKLLDYEEGKKEAIQLNEHLVNKLKACEMLRSRGEQFIDGLYNALDQGKPVKLTNTKGDTRWIKRMCATEIRNNTVTTKTFRNDIYLTAVINTQEQKIQKLKSINNELKIKLLKCNEQQEHSLESKINETYDVNDIDEIKSFTIRSISSAEVKFIDDLEISDEYCE